MKVEYLAVGFLIALVGFVPSSMAAEKASASPETLIRAVYEDHQPWNNKEINFRSREALRNYFDDDVTNLFLEMYALQARTTDLCMFNADPILNAQDYGNNIKQEVIVQPSPGQPNVYEVLFKLFDHESAPSHRQKYHLIKTNSGWKITNITYPGNPEYSLKRALIASKQMCLESITSTK